MAKAVDEEPDIEKASAEVKAQYDARREKVGDEPMQQVERWLLAEALRDHDNNKTKTAQTLGITREGLHKKLNKYSM